MINKIFSVKLDLIIEIAVMLIAIVLWWLVHENLFEISSPVDELDIFIDVILFVSILSIFYWKNNNSRHFIIAFIYIVLAMLTSLLSISSMTYFLSALAYGYLVIGFINQVLFRNSKQ
jgi:hypothetical protein